MQDAAHRYWVQCWEQALVQMQAQEVTSMIMEWCLWQQRLSNKHRLNVHGDAAMLAMSERPRFNSLKVRVRDAN